MANAYLAVDLGASSGRAILGVLDGNPSRLTLEELHRFEHQGLPTPVGPVWDLTSIWRHILTGLRLAVGYCDSNGHQLKSVGVDCWGVDWAVLGNSGELLSLPHCYRDPRNEDAFEKLVDKVGGFDEIYQRAGIQQMSINTIFQLYAHFQNEPHLVSPAAQILFIPDLFHYWLAGEMAVERTIASTSSLLNIDTLDWDPWLIDAIELPIEIFGSIVQPGTLLGTVQDEVVEQTGAAGVAVVCPASHDTASAVAAVPAVTNHKWAFLSSGTWSLLGAEIDSPLVTPESQAVPFTNELGVGGKVRFLKNITGLWMVQELRRELNRMEENDYDFEQLMVMAELAEPFRTIVDPGHEPFLQPGEMAEKIRAFAQCTNQPEPETVGDLVRCCLDSLALCYRQTLEKLESILGYTFDVLHIVGGGSQNKLLNQLTANAIERPVVVGPVEATAIGNVLVQAMGTGAIADANEIREVVSRSFEPLTFKPEGTGAHWQEAAEILANRWSRQESGEAMN